MRERDMGTYQMLWDCPACETEKLLGLDHRHCPNCGSAQDPQRRYFPPAGEEVAVRDHRYTGADKVCPACDAPAAAVANNCASCGSGLDEAKAAARRAEQVASAGGFAADSAKAARDEFREARARERGDAPPPPAKPKSRVVPVVLAIVALLVLSATVFLFWKKSVEVEVAGHRWERVISVEEYKRVSESAWRDQVPVGATGVSCNKQERSKKKVQDGETCTTKRKDMGDGTYKQVEECRPKYREEPVYDDHCRYQVERWTEARKAKAEGMSLESAPRWPEVQLGRTGTCLGCEREGARSATYEVRFIERPSGEEKRCTLEEARWASLAVGSRWQVKSRVIGGGLDCDSLQAVR